MKSKDRKRTMARSHHGTGAVKDRNSAQSVPRAEPSFSPSLSAAAAAAASVAKVRVSMVTTRLSRFRLNETKNGEYLAPACK